MKQKFFYQSGFPFSECLARNIDPLKDRVVNNKASGIIIDGSVGEGKTTLAVHCADYCMDRFMNTPIDFKLQYADSGASFQDKLIACYEKKLPVLIYDEAGDFSKYAVLSHYNKSLRNAFEKYRAFKVLVILTLPCFDLLDASLFKMGVIRFVLNCYNRSNTFGDFRGYSIDRASYVLKHMSKESHPLKAYKKITPNFRGHFLDLPPNRSSELAKISIAGKQESITKGSLRLQGYLTVSELARELDMSKVWVNNTLKKLKIKPSRLYKRIRYYHEDTANKVAVEIKYDKK